MTTEEDDQALGVHIEVAWSIDRRTVLSLASLILDAFKPSTPSPCTPAYHIKSPLAGFNVETPEGFTEFK